VCRAERGGQRPGAAPGRGLLAADVTSSRERALDRPPAIAVVGALLAGLLFAIPLLGLLWRAPWRATWDVLSDPTAREALRLSIETSLAATFIAVVLGTPLAWVQARV